MDGFKALADVVLAGLAGCQLTEVLHHSQLSLGLRHWVLDHVEDCGVRGFFARLCNCPFCLSHWVCGMFAIWVILTWWSPYFYFPVLVFAATRVANLTNDLAHSFNRTPKHDVLQEISEETRASSPDCSSAGFDVRAEDGGVLPSNDTSSAAGNP